MNQDASNYIEGLTQWQQELTELRNLLLDCGLTEDFKWKHPCYTVKGKNIVILQGFKDYCALLFTKGALLKDPEHILERQTENTQSARQLRFKGIQEIEESVSVIKKYVLEAVANEASGLKIPLIKVSDLEFPDELAQKYMENPTFKSAFESLTPGRQKGYLLHFNQTKKSTTRIARIEKYTSRILDGKGLHDCVCGLSKRMPNCDGSHTHAIDK